MMNALARLPQFSQYLQQLKMVTLIPAPADCAVQSVIKFLNAQSVTLIKIHQLCLVYGPNVMSKQMVHHYCNLQQVDNMCMMMSAVGGHLILRMTLWSLCGNALWRSSLHNYGTQQSFPTDFSLFIAQNCHSVQKIVCQLDAKVTDTRTQSNVHGVSIDISAVVPS